MVRSNIQINLYDIIESIITQYADIIKIYKEIKITKKHHTLQYIL